MEQEGYHPTSRSGGGRAVRKKDHHLREGQENYWLQQSQVSGRAKRGGNMEGLSSNRSRGSQGTVETAEVVVG